ncbi:unnamed protein product [Oncorhynchus mykiss]|uniref:Rab-GAP TBC domain-containing protein n=1 Tax=Oncorhynchus mykiss TaxID=8022 RepID=A0A060Y6X2_ONCMY|nr:unnamed protein product [Oncorhynchus mykiss]
MGMKLSLSHLYLLAWFVNVSMFKKNTYTLPVKSLRTPTHSRVFLTAQISKEKRQSIITLRHEVGDQMMSACVVPTVKHGEGGVMVTLSLMDQAVNMWHPTPRKSSCFSCSQNGSPVGSLSNGCNQDRAPLKLLCDTMKYQIISRAFYGWLAYCRHLSTVRIHLSALVNPTIIDPNVPHDARGGLTVDVWSSFLQDCSAYDEHELLRMVYYGGVAPTIRKEVWPFLLGHYHFDMTQKRRLEVDKQVRAYYEQTMKEWLGCEAIVKQREGEKHAEAIAKCNSVERPGPVQRDSTISTDSSQSTSSEKQIAQSDSSSSTQAFGSVEEVDPIESEMKPEEGKEVSKIPLKDCPDVANRNVTSESGDPPKKISVGSGLPEQPQSTNNNSPATKLPATDLTAGEEHPKAPTQESKAPESKEVECSELVEIIQIPERVKEREDVKSLGNIETVNKVAGNELSEVSTTKDPKLPVRAAKASVSEPSCATEPSLTEGNKATTIAVEAGIAEKEDPNFSDIEEITESELQKIKTPQTSEACLEARASVTVTAHSMHSPDTLDSDDSPSALEMEDIPTAWARPLSGLMAPPAAPFLALGRVVSGEPVLHASSNTSLDGTEPTLSEEEPEMESLYPQSDFLVVTDELKPEVSPVVVSPAGTTYSQEQLDLYLLNLHRIDKDVRRCDRTYWYFTPANLEKLRNIMCSYVWQHLEIGYVQGMCDLLAPLLVILDDEVMAFSCFSELMKRMNQNFPHGGAMDSHFANMRSLIQILDSELFELMQMNGDYTHFYFCYRWFLLDFKREMLYDDVFSVWESIWAATYTSSTHFVLFIALALVEIYRDIILENNMDFTDIIKFFNEMAEHHNIPQVLTMARDLVLKVQTLIENK